MEEGLKVFIEQNTGLVVFVLLLSLILKGFALWRAAQLSHKGWFIAIILINSLGILETIYLLVVSKKYSVEIKQV